MSFNSLQAIILAAGKSTRFNTGRSKLSEKICGREMILYPIKLFEAINIPCTVVVGYQKDLIVDIVNKALPNKVTFVEQKNQAGTGDALMHTQQHWHADHILIINGDCPLITQELMQRLIEEHITSQAALSFVTAHYEGDEYQYGKVIEKDGIVKIVEAQDAHADDGHSCFINAGIYIIKKNILADTIHSLQPHGKNQEFYITDLVELLSKKKYIIRTINGPFDATRGVNTPKELWYAEHIKRAENISHWMNRGVIFRCTQSIQIDLDVMISPGTIISAGVHILNGTRIGFSCFIGPFSILEKATIDDRVHIESHCVIKNSHVKSNATIGPYAHIRKESMIDEETTIGNFVEISASSIGKHTKAKHLAYIGNALIGQQVNIGAGTITCNYDGFSKNTTTIHDGAFIGSNNTLIAPLTIGNNAYTAAGSVINQNVPEHALAIARTNQINKEEYALKLRIKHLEQGKSSDSNNLFRAATKIINDGLQET